MSQWLSLRSNRYRVAELFLYILFLWGALLPLAGVVFDLNGAYTLAWPLLLIVPVTVFLGRRFDIRYLSNLVAVTLVFCLLIYSMVTDMGAPGFPMLFVAAPVAFYLLSNLYLGTLLALISLFAFLALYAVSPLEGSLGTEDMIQTLLVYLSVLVLAGLYERDWLSLESRLLVNSDIDFLTQIHNRRGMTRMLQKSMADSTRHHHRLAVILFDIDDFDPLIAGRGREAGDRILVELSGLLARHTRAGDTLGRWDNDTFMLLAPSTDLAGAEQLADKLRRLVAAYYFEGVGHIRARFGIAALEQENLDDFLLKAETALQRARVEGG